MVSLRLLVLAINLVGHLASLNHCVNLAADFGNALRNLLNQRNLDGCHLLILVGEYVLNLFDVLQKFGLIGDGCRNDVVGSHTAHYASLNLNLLRIDFPFNLVASLEFLFGVNAHTLEHCNGFRFCEFGKHFRH